MTAAVVPRGLVGWLVAAAADGQLRDQEKGPGEHSRPLRNINRPDKNERKCLTVK